MKLLEQLKSRVGASISVQLPPQVMPDGRVVNPAIEGRLIYAGEDGLILRQPAGDVYVRPEIIGGPIVDRGIIDVIPADALRGPGGLVQ